MIKRGTEGELENIEKFNWEMLGKNHNNKSKKLV